MPIGYNKDKSGNLVFARGFGFVLILFPQKKPLKRGNEIGGDKTRCYIKDKKQLGNFGGHCMAQTAKVISICNQKGGVGNGK